MAATVTVMSHVLPAVATDRFGMATDALPSEDQLQAIVTAMDSHWLHFTPPQRERCTSALDGIRVAKSALC